MRSKKVRIIALAILACVPIATVAVKVAAHRSEKADDQQVIVVTAQPTLSYKPRSENK